MPTLTRPASYKNWTPTYMVMFLFGYGFEFCLTIVHVHMKRWIEEGQQGAVPMPEQQMDRHRFVVQTAVLFALWLA